MQGSYSFASCSNEHPARRSLNLSLGARHFLVLDRRTSLPPAKGRAESPVGIIADCAGDRVDLELLLQQLDGEPHPHLLDQLLRRGVRELVHDFAQMRRRDPQHERQPLDAELRIRQMLPDQSLQKKCCHDTPP